MKRIVILLLLFLLLNGCIDLVKNGDETIKINYLKNGSVKFEHSIKGEKGELFFDWEGDCTQKAKDLLDANIVFLQKQILETEKAKHLTEEQKSDLIEENNRKINTLLSIKSTIQCSLKDDNSMALLEYSFILSQGFENIKLFNSNYDFFLIKTDDVIESTIKVNNTANQQTGNLLKKIVIYSEARIDSIQPENKIQRKNEVYEIEMLGMDGKEITVSIKRKEKSLPKEEEKKEEKDLLSLLMEGLTIQRITSLEKEHSIQWIPTVLAALILLFAVSKIIKAIKSAQQKKEKQKAEQKSLEDRILEKTSKPESQKNKFLYMTQPKKPTSRLIKPKFTEKEKKQIKTIIMSLKEHFHNYSKEEIKKAILGKGYSEKIAQEVADFFYP
jgi:hypothetical protein